MASKVVNHDELNTALTNYLPLSGGTLNGDLQISNKLVISRTDTTAPFIRFENQNGRLGFLVIEKVNGHFKRYTDNGSTNYTILDSSDSEVSLNGSTLTVKINGVSKSLTNTDTKNTAGSTDTSSKIFLIGATSQAANPQTYSHDTAYVGTDGCLYSNSTKVSVEGHTHSYLPLTGGTITGNLIISGGYISGATAYYEASDERLKENIRTIESNRAKEVIMAINPVTFNWKNDAATGGQGVIAQQFEKIIPNAVKESEDGYKSVDYISIIPYLVKQVQILTEEVERLKSALREEFVQ